jgi:glycosyltransferase involved in cell wall biosynthesis
LKVGDIVKYTEWRPSSGYGSGNPKISVLLPTFRRCSSGLFLKAATSVLNQSIKDLELIIIDDGSTDGTADQIKELMQKDARVSCLRHPRNVGLPAISEYEGYMKARAKHIAFAFDDTEFSPRALEEMLQQAESRGLPFLHGYVEMSVYEEVTGSRQVIPLGRGGLSQATLFSHNYIPNNAVLLDKRVIEHVGLYDPHICMARLCDWDLWQRVAWHYKIEYVDLFVGYEHGPSTHDSLGKTVLMDSWTVNEWMKADRNELLKPNNYLEYDVLAIPSNLTRQAKYVIKDLEDQYRDKFWYQDVPITVGGNTGNDDTSSSITCRRDNGYLLVIAPIYDATISLSFDYLAESFSRRIRVIQGSDWMGCEAEMAGASAVVIVRNLFDFSPWVECGKKLGIPLYYYADDNFMQLRQEPGCAPEFKQHSPENLKATLDGFSGVLLSTYALVDVFRKAGIHDNLYYYPPVIKKIEGKRENASWGNPFTIAFMGGPHRTENFYRYVAPAIRRLAENFPIRLCLPESSAEQAKLKAFMSSVQNHNLEILTVPRDISYDLTIRNYRECNPDILVHINSNTGNNAYKTENAIINAALVGAVPVLSDGPPYDALRNENIGLLCLTDEDSWYEAIMWLYKDRVAGREMYDRLVEYCRRNYSGAANEPVLTEILSQHPAPSMALRDVRYKQLAKFKDPVNQSQTVAVIRWVWAKIKLRCSWLNI